MEMKLKRNQRLPGRLKEHQSSQGTLSFIYKNIPGDSLVDISRIKRKRL